MKAGDVTAGRQDHRRPMNPHDGLAHVETVPIGQRQVHKDDVRMQSHDLVDRRSRIVRLADDVEALGLEQPPRGHPKACVVIHNQQRGTHPEIVSLDSAHRISGDPQPRAGLVDAGGGRDIS